MAWPSACCWYARAIFQKNTVDAIGKCSRVPKSSFRPNGNSFAKKPGQILNIFASQFVSEITFAKQDNIQFSQNFKEILKLYLCYLASSIAKRERLSCGTASAHALAVRY